MKYETEKKATIIIKDEVNCSIKNLDLEMRKKLVHNFEYEIPGAKYMPAYRLGRWNGKVSFFNLGGSTYINLLPEILPLMLTDGWDIVVQDDRDYKKEFKLDTVDADTYSHVTWPEKHTIAGEPIVLRDYQIEIVNNFLENPQCLQEVATGAGKTLITASLSERVQNYGRSIIIVPNKTLVIQTEEDYVNMGLDVGVYYGDRKDTDKTHTICTWQSLNTLMKDTKSGKAQISINEFLKDAVCVMVDEAHSAKADALKNLLTGPMSKIPFRWGLTGTVPKEDYAFKSMHVGLGDVINCVSAKELQDKGILAKCNVKIVQLIDHAEHANYQSELKYLLTNPDRLDALGDIITNASKTGNTLVLVDRVESGKELSLRLGDDAVFVSGATKNSIRKEHYDEVADANNKIIVATYGVASVGINIPRIFNLILIEPGKSFVRVIQSIGRGIRKAEDKEEVQIWDITSTCRFAKRHLTKRKKFYREAQYPYALEKMEWK